MLPLLPSWPNYKAQGAEIFHYVMQRIDYNPTTTFTKSTIVLRWVISFTDGARAKFQSVLGLQDLVCTISAQSHPAIRSGEQECMDGREEDGWADGRMGGWMDGL